MNHTIASLFHINPRFLRSTHLERDFTTPDSCRGYILTDFTKSCLERLADGLVAGSTKRAWRLTGDYGTGKSSFALVLAHLFSGHHGALENLQKVVLNPDLSEAVDIDGGGKENLNIIPILVTGNRLPLRIALFRALRKYLAAAYTNDSKTLSPRLQHIVKIGDDIPSIDDEEIVEALVQFSKVVKSDSKGSGVLLILDELGKFLEFAAMYPDASGHLSTSAVGRSRLAEWRYAVVCFRTFTSRGQCIHRPSGWGVEGGVGEGRRAI